jgi:hypothetical protein
MTGNQGNDKFMSLWGIGGKIRSPSWRNAQISCQALLNLNGLLLQPSPWAVQTKTLGQIRQQAGQMPDWLDNG